jgi:predicted  nucleic acid-binding Zn-ribbon protein
MKNNKAILGVALLSAVVLSGCAAGKNYQADADAANSKLASLQSQLEGKNREIAGLQDQVRALKEQVFGLSQQLEAANKAKADAESRLYQALDKLAAKSAADSARKVVAKSNSIK